VPLPGDENVRRHILAPAVAAANERLAAAGEQEIPEACQCDKPCGCPKGLTPHGLRHIFATVMLYLGKQAGHTARQLGHADAGFTYSRYYKRFSERPGQRERVTALVDGGVSGLTDVLEVTPAA
jgi:integrase